MKIKIVTHNGSFHIDEIFAIAFIKLFVNKNVEILRTRDENELKDFTEDPNIWVIDVGRSYNKKKRNFDHHQASFKLKWEGKSFQGKSVPYSSCGLVWKYLKDQGLIQKRYSDDVIQVVEDFLVVKVDMHDNRVASLPQGQLFKLCNRENNTIEDFMRALTIAEWHLDDVFLFAEQTVKNRKKVNEADFIMGGQIAIFNEELSHIINPVSRETEAKIIIMPKVNSHTWSVRSIARASEGVLTPVWWRGLSNQELIEKSGVNDLAFVHKAGYLAVANTKEAAIKVAKAMLE